MQLANRRRMPSEMVIDILRAAPREGTSLTSLVYRSYSKFIRTKKYVDLLVAR